MKLLHDTKIKYVVVPCGRRFGKTELGLNVMVYYGLNWDAMSILYMTPRGDQRNTAFNEFVSRFGDAPFIFNVNRSESFVTFRNKSRIYFKLGSFPSVESIRGKKFDVLVLDEFAMYNKDVFESILEPTLATQKDFKVLFLSTPRGKGQFYTYYKRGLDTAYPKWASYRASSDKNPLVSKEFLEDVKKSIPEKIYKQEYEAEFIDDSGALFENIDSCTSSKKFEFVQTEKYFAGIDLGFTNDFCVVNVLDSRGNVVDWDRFNQVSLTDASKRIFEFLKKWGNPITLVENNQYQGVSEMIRNLGYKKLYDFNTNSKTKKEIIEDLIVAFQEKTISIPNNELYRLELLEFGYHFNPKTRNVSYMGLGEHDDIVMSLAIAWHCYKKHSKKIAIGFI